MVTDDFAVGEATGAWICFRIASREWMDKEDGADTTTTQPSLLF